MDESHELFSFSQCNNSYRSGDLKLFSLLRLWLFLIFVSFIFFTSLKSSSDTGIGSFIPIVNVFVFCCWSDSGTLQIRINLQKLVTNASLINPHLSGDLASGCFVLFSTSTDLDVRIFLIFSGFALSSSDPGSFIPITNAFWFGECRFSVERTSIT